MLNFRQLSIFVAVAELGSFTKAAKHLFMTQPAISWQIKSLETELGLTLLERGDRNVSLTEAGKLFYTEAKRLNNLYERLMADIEEYKGLGKGNLKMGASTIPGEYLLPNYIGRFKQLYPEVNISLSIGDTRRIVEKLLMDSIQLGIIGAKLEETKLDFFPFKEDHLILIAAPDHPWGKKDAIGLTDLFPASYVLREEGSGTRMVIEQELAKQDFSLNDFDVVMELGSTRAVITAVAAGLGVSWVSHWAVQEALSLGTVRQVKVEGLEMKRTIYLAIRRNRTLSPLAKAFADYLLQGNSKE
ncbi:MAG: LysR family transcriptional regulator [Clostridia bacterium]|nr:LysR family transcriptional regulator [Clostridia bacterium]